eukprot:scaffold26148_cov58-Attheya_sp.AAC.3
MNDLHRRGQMITEKHDKHDGELAPTTSSRTSSTGSLHEGRRRLLWRSKQGCRFVTVTLLSLLSLWCCGSLLLFNKKWKWTTYSDAPHANETEIVPLAVQAQLAVQLAIPKELQSANHFDWGDLDLTVPPDGCGWWKCFFRSSSDEAMGYLVGFTNGWNHDTHQALSDYVWRGMLAGWEVGERLSLGNRTLLVEPPRKVPVPSGVVLSSMRALVETTSVDPHIWILHNKTYSNEMLIQKAQRVPSPNLHIRCSLFNGKRRCWHYVVAPVPRPNVTHNFSSLVKDKKRFARTFEKETKTLRAVMELEPHLWHDFQIMVDAAGHMYYMDLDRVQEGAEHFKYYPNSFRVQELSFQYVNRVKESIVSGKALPPRILEFYSMRWSELTDKERKFAELLGYSSTGWNRKDKLLIYQTPFHSTGMKQQTAAVCLELEQYFVGGSANLDRSYLAALVKECG